MLVGISAPSQSVTHPTPPHPTTAGSIQASPAQYGETLETEQLRGGSFLDAKDVPAERWERLMDDEVGNAHHKLFGGAQYHRALREFTLAVRMMKTPTVTEDEIANAAGVGDMHDGVNFMRAACVIAVEKVRGLGFLVCVVVVADGDGHQFPGPTSVPASPINHNRQTKPTPYHRRAPPSSPSSRRCGTARRTS